MTSLDVLYDIFLRHPEVCTDSRKVRAGSLFFGLKGEQFDGNDYAEAAIMDGAAYAVIDDQRLYETSPWGCLASMDAKLLWVPDVLEALQALALHHREHCRVPVLALTGTNGKTTTKELITAVLQTRFPTCATQGNLNNHIGVPLSLLRIKPNDQKVVMEMGANHPGEIAELCRIAKPDFGLITNVGKAHLEGFGSLEGVLQTKLALYDASKQLFVNADDALLSQAAEERGKWEGAIRYGLHYQQARILPPQDAQAFLRMEVPGFPLIEAQFIGDYNAYNVLAALAVGSRFGCDPKEMAAAIAAYAPSNNRSQWQQTAHNALIIDAYNANPSSMAAALDNFDRLSSVERKVLILGDMLELGTDSDAEHKAVVSRLLDRYPPEALYLIGPRLGAAAAGSLASCFATVDELRAFLQAQPLQGKLILMKGSRGMRLERALECL